MLQNHGEKIERGKGVGERMEREERGVVAHRETRRRRGLKGNDAKRTWNPVKSCKAANINAINMVDSIHEGDMALGSLTALDAIALTKIVN